MGLGGFLYFGPSPNLRASARRRAGDKLAGRVSGESFQKSTDSGLRGVAPGRRFWHGPADLRSPFWAGKASIICAGRARGMAWGGKPASEATSMTALWVIVLCGALSIVYAIWATASVLKSDAGNPRMQEIAAAVREGAQAYLKRQYMTIGLVGVVIFVLLAYFLGMLVAVGFLIGAVLSGAAGFIGMNVSVRANVRTAQAAITSLAGGLELAFKAGAITGLLVAGLALRGVTIFFAKSPLLVNMMTLPLAIGGICILTSIAGTFFVKLGASQSIMGALYKGLIATGVLSLIGVALVIYWLIGFGPLPDINSTGMALFEC